MWRHARTFASGLSFLLTLTAIVAGMASTASSADGGSGDPLLTEERVGVLKCAVATCTAALLLWGTALRRAGRESAFGRSRDALLLGLGVLGALGWSNFLQLRYAPGYGHPQDVYHYYLGSKYFAELGYTRLYACTTVADAESGFRDLAMQRSIRNLETYDREAAANILRDPTRCTRHFSPERWQTFKHDVGWFRARMPEAIWRGTLADHGYNPSPAWGALGKALVSEGPVTERNLLPLLLLDPALLIVMWAFVWKAFGWRTTCVALVFWGTNLPDDYLWTGGAFLRQGWLVTMVIGICCLRMRRMAAGGVFLTASALLRVFPVMAIFGVALGAGSAMWRSRRFTLSPAHRRFAVGCAAAAAILIALSFATAGGPRAWVDFAKNIRFHSNMAFLTNVGLKTLLSYDPETRFERIQQDSGSSPRAWNEARDATFARRRPLFFGILLGYMLLLARASDREEGWVAAVLGAGSVVMLVTMANYYYAVLLGFAFLRERREGVAAALCGLSALTWWIDWTWHQPDEIYTWVSLATVVFVAAATGSMAWRRVTDDAASGETVGVGSDGG